MGRAKRPERSPELPKRQHENVLSCGEAALTTPVGGIPPTLSEVLDFAFKKLNATGLLVKDWQTVDLKDLFDVVPPQSEEGRQLLETLADLTRRRIMAPQSMGNSIWTIGDEGRAIFARMESVGHRLTTGDVVGTWVVLRRLGGGAQADVYLVRHLDHHADSNWRVLKYLLPWEKAVSKAPTSENQRARFEAEVRAMESLASENCPHIVPILDSSLEADAGQAPWYVMPYYPVPLRRDTEGRRSEHSENYIGNLERVLDIAIPVGETLAFMHEREDVHRDLHTGNVLFLERGGEPFVADFGLVHAGRDPQRTSLTGETEAFGAWRARPPELTEGGGDKRDPRSDVYMLGVLVYELLRGKDVPVPLQMPDGQFKHAVGETAIEHILPSDKRAALLSKLLERVVANDVKERCSASDLLGALRTLRSMTGAAPGVEESWLPPRDELARVASAAFRSPKAKLLRARAEMDRFGNDAIARLNAIRPTDREGFSLEFEKWAILGAGEVPKQVLALVNRVDIALMIQTRARFLEAPFAEESSRCYLTYCEGEVAICHVGDTASAGALCEVTLRSFMEDPCILGELVRQTGDRGQQLMGRLVARLKSELGLD